MRVTVFMITCLLCALDGRASVDTASADGGARASSNPGNPTVGQSGKGNETNETDAAPTLHHEGGADAFPIGVGAGSPRLQNASIEFAYLRGLRNASIELAYLRGLRNASIEVGYLRGLRGATIGFDLFTEGRELEVMQQELDFGQAPLCVGGTGIVSVTNIGYRTLTVSSLSVTAGSDVFSVLTATPLQLAQGQSEDVGMAFVPYASGPAAGILEITWIDDDESSVTVPVALTGEGGTDPAAAPTLGPFGHRHLDVSPAPAGRPVAILVTGDAGNPGVSCVSLYVQADGTLDPVPVFQAYDDWGTVLVGDEPIIPDTMYNVQTDCGLLESPSLTLASTATTEEWGDIVPAFGSDPGSPPQPDLDDILCIIDGFVANPDWQGACPFCDIISTAGGCEPDSACNLDDILAVLDAFAGVGYPCDPPCP